MQRRSRTICSGKHFTRTIARAKLAGVLKGEMPRAVRGLRFLGASVPRSSFLRMSNAERWTKKRRNPSREEAVHLFAKSCVYSYSVTAMVREAIQFPTAFRKGE